jgi:hypothetical protein
MRGEGSCGTRVGASHTSRPPAFPSRADGQYDYTFGIPVRAVSPASQDPESSPPISLWLLSVQHGNEPSFGYPNNHISLLLLLRNILHNGTGLGNEIKDAYGGHRGHMRVCKCSVGEVRSVVSTLPRIYLQRPDCDGGRGGPLGGNSFFRKPRFYGFSVFRLYAILKCL